VNTTQPAPSQENGAQATLVPPATQPQQADDRPKTKTGAIRQLLKEGIDDNTTIHTEVRQRWGYEVNSNDVGNARKAEKDEKEKKRLERQQKREQKSGIPKTAPFPEATTDLVAAQKIVDALCLVYGADLIGDLVQVARSKAVVILCNIAK
jgi:hypothetical protein